MGDAGYKRDLDFTRQLPFAPPYLAFSPRAAPAIALSSGRTFDGHPWRQRSPQDVGNEVGTRWRISRLKEIFFDATPYIEGRMLEMCKVFKPLKFTWSCTSRVHVDYETLRQMKDAGCRLFIVGFESGNDQILKNIKKGATVERARKFVKDCKRAGIRVHADFIIGLPGETRETTRAMVRQRARCETIREGATPTGDRKVRLLRANNCFKGTRWPTGRPQAADGQFQHLSGARARRVGKVYASILPPEGVAASSAGILTGDEGSGSKRGARV